MKVALVHDYLKEIGGAEKVLMALKEIWPMADVYTAFGLPKFWGSYKDELSKWNIKESWAKRLPFKSKFLSYYTIISPLFFKFLDLRAYDLVVVSATGGYFPCGVKTGPRTKLAVYWHTPPRFLYGYPVATMARYRWYWRVPSAIANHFLRMVDFVWAQRPAIVIANSRNVAGRIRKYYRREAEVVYPPIEAESGKWRIENRSKSRDYYAVVSRIVGTKNIDLAVEAANKYGFKLKVAGRAINKPGEEIVRRIRGKTVEYLGEVSEEDRVKLLAGARGFLALETDADFGMTTVEPMVYGVPVVAFRGGGYLETVEEGKNGVFFDEQTPESLWAAMKRFERINWDREYIRRFADKFSKERFKKQMLELVNKHAGIA